MVISTVFAGLANGRSADSSESGKQLSAFDSLPTNLWQRRMAL